MNNKHYVGRRVSSFQRYDDIGPVTGIALVVDDDNEYLAGDQNGYVLEVPCSYGTQAMADQLLAAAKGKVYKGYSATNAPIPALSELGDGITVNGLYGLLASREVDFGGGHYSDIAAPGENTVEHRYPVGMNQSARIKRSTDRKIADTRSSITKTAEEIRLEVSQTYATKGALGDTETRLSSSITTTAEGIKQEVSETYSTKGELGAAENRFNASIEATAKSITSTVEANYVKIESVNEFSDAVTKSLGDLQKQIDGQIETFYYNEAPTLTNAPASEWKTELDKQKHEGDLYFDKSTGYAYRFFNNGNAWTWQRIKDTDITTALEDAARAQDTADKKRRVFVAQPTPPYDIGDLWVQGENPETGDIMRCQNAREAGVFYQGDWVKASKYTDDTIAINAKSIAEQAADHFTWIVQEGGDKSNFTLTPRMASLAANTIDLTGYVTFNSLKEGGTTAIDGSRITTGTIAAERLNLSAYSTTGETETKISTEIKAFEKGLSLSVSNSDSSSVLTLKAGETELSSQSITFNGLVNFVTKDGLSTSGSTIINGDNITTGTIAAERVNLSAYSTIVNTNDTITREIQGIKEGLKLSVTNHDSTSSLSLTSGGAEISSAEITFNGLVNFVSKTDIYTAGTTTIDGGKITTKSIDVSKISVDDLSAIGATIGGWHLTNSKLYGGVENDPNSGVAVMQIPTANTSYVFAAGGKSHSSYADCPFRVTKNGHVYASAITLTGEIQNGSKITGTITGTSATISGGTFKSGTISGGTLSGGTGGTFSSGTLSSCSLGGTKLSTGSSSGAFYSESGQAYVSGNSVQLKSSGSGSLTVTGSGTSIVGAFSATGEKKRVIKTAHFGERGLHAFETPIPTFSDYGTAALDETGVFYIVVDTIFAETVNCDYLPAVFLTKYGDGDIWVENVAHDIITVCGTPGLKFAWETRYAQANALVDRLSVVGFDYMDVSREDDYSLTAELAYEHSKENIDYAEIGYEYFTEFERSIEAA